MIYCLEKNIFFIQTKTEKNLSVLMIWIGKQFTLQISTWIWEKCQIRKKKLVMKDLSPILLIFFFRGELYNWQLVLKSVFPCEQKRNERAQLYQRINKINMIYYFYYTSQNNLIFFQHIKNIICNTHYRHLNHIAWSKKFFYKHGLINAVLSSRRRQAFFDMTIK